jgi:hypothetical protein
VTTLPTSLVRFENQLADAIDRERSRRPRRLVLRTALAGVAVATVALGILSAFPGSGPSVVDRAAAALVPSNGGLLHVVMTVTQTGPEGSSTSSRTESWQASSPPYDQRRIVNNDGLEIAIADGVPQLYDPETNTIYIGPRQDLKSMPPKARAERAGGRNARTGMTVDAGGDLYREKILLLLDSGRAREDGRTTVDGREAIRIVASEGGMMLLVDADSYEPIEWRVSENGMTTEAFFPTYERLPADAASADLLSLTAQHPDATIDRDPAHYEAARLAPKG